MKSRRETRPPRILYLSFYFPPSRASGVYRARATANFLADHGWDVTAFAAPLAFLYDVIGSVDEDLASTVHPDVAVERPHLSLYRWERDLRRYGRFRGSLPTVSRRFFEWREKKVFPEQYASWAVNSVRRALQLHRKRKFDVILATGNPFASFAGAWAIHKLTGVPYVVDYRDSWTLDLFEDRDAFPPGHPAWNWEKRILREAGAAVFVNDALRTWHAERYPKAADRMLVVPNGWDPDLLQLSPAVTEPAATAAADGDAVERHALQFGYLGTVTNNQPVEAMAEAFRLARQHPDLAGAELNIHGHLGFFKGSGSFFMNRLGLGAAGEVDRGNDMGLRYRGPVSKTDVGSVYEQNDVLVFLAGGGRYVTSGKIFEYMASGRPIVSVHAPDIAACEVLDGYPLWFNADSLEIDALAQSFIAAGKAARDCTPAQRTAARQHAQKYARSLLLRPLEVRLRDLAGAEQLLDTHPVGDSAQHGQVSS
jgi:glycosyltransferase involved in cell wall biosynthesis